MSRAPTYDGRVTSSAAKRTLSSIEEERFATGPMQQWSRKGEQRITAVRFCARQPGVKAIRFEFGLAAGQRYCVDIRSQRYPVLMTRST